MTDCQFENGLPSLITKKGLTNTYDLVVGSTGVNSSGGALFENLGIEYEPPKLTKTFICELALGEEAVERQFGSSMHVFLLSSPV